MESHEKSSIGTIIREAGRKIKATLKAIDIEPAEPEINVSPLNGILPKESEYPNLTPTKKSL